MPFDIKKNVLLVFSKWTNRTAVITSLVTILALVSFAIISVNANRNAVLTGEIETMSSTSRLLAQHVQRIFFSADLDISSLENEIEKIGMKSGSELARYAASRKTFERMQEMIAHTADIEALGIVSADGDLYSSRNWPRMNVNVADRAYFIALKKGQQLVIDEPILSKITGQEIIVQARRLDSPEGKFLGVVYATFSTSRFSKLFSDATAADENTVYLIDAHGKVYSSTESKEKGDAVFGDIWKIAAPLMLRTDEVRLYGEAVKVRGLHHLLTLNNISGYPFTIAVTKPENLVLKDWRKLVWLLSALTLASIALVIFSFYAYSRQARAKAALDLTTLQLKTSNAELMESKERLTDTQAQSLMGQWELDLICGKLSWTNQVFEIFEIDRAKFGATYEAFLEAIHPDDREAVNTAYTTSLENKLPYEIAHRLLFPDGRIKYVIEHCRTDFDPQGKPLYSTGSVQDITALKTIENELVLARNAAVETSRAKSDFLANMSHEIRTPMHAIIGFTSLLQESDLNTGQLEKLQRIDTASQHLLSLINNILDLSKIEAGSMVLDSRPFRLGEVFAKLNVMISQRVLEKGLELKMETGNLPDRLVGDEVRLTQALLNYLSNAVKFTQRGTITLRVGMLDTDENWIMVRFEVEDTGAGIAPDKLESIFNAFEQADNSLTRAHGGSGLGLTITRSFARLMGGDAGVSSKPGGGSLFWYTARLGKDLTEPAGVAPKLDQNTLQRDYSGYRVLLAEDEPVNRILFMEILSMMHGLQVDTASDGVIALEMAGCSHYDAIMMDMQMPNMNGLEATRNIRKLPQHKNTPIIAMTGNAFAEDRLRCLEAGMNDFMAKPFTPKQLIEGMGKWLLKKDRVSL